jgi:hypothetical protein
VSKNSWGTREPSEGCWTNWRQGMPCGGRKCMPLMNSEGNRAPFDGWHSVVLYNEGVQEFLGYSWTLGRMLNKLKTRNALWRAPASSSKNNNLFYQPFCYSRRRNLSEKWQLLDLVYCASLEINKLYPLYYSFPILVRWLRGPSHNAALLWRRDCRKRTTIGYCFHCPIFVPLF